jgi:TolB-like protein
MASPSTASSDILDSWKLIAEYLHRDVRTLQRWERTKLLPVHRLPGGPKPGVFALKSELDAWRRNSTVPVMPSVAVLPFASLSSETEALHFCDGLADDIITALAQVPGLQVTARTSSFAFRDNATSVREIGTALNASALLEGSVQWVGDRIRVSAQLIDASSGYHLWSQSYDRSPADVFEIQDDITRSVVRGLKVALVCDRTLMHRHTANHAAYCLWLKGRALALRQSPESLAESGDCFKRALMLDCEYALAWLGLADNHWQQAYFGMERPRQAIPLARDAAQLALDYDPTLGEAFCILACVQAAYDFNWRGAERTFQTALHFSPSSAIVRGSFGLFLLEPLGRLDQALEQLELALAFDPLSAVSHFQLGHLFMLRRDYDRALPILQTALELDPECWWARWVMAGVLGLQGKSAEGHAIAEQATLDSGGNALPLGALGAYKGWVGLFDDARAILANLRQTGAIRYVPSICLAWLHFGLRDLDSGFELLHSAIDERDLQILHIPANPLYDALRSDARFPQLLHEMNLPLSS